MISFDYNEARHISIYDVAKKILEKHKNELSNEFLNLHNNNLDMHLVGGMDIEDSNEIEIGSHVKLQ